MTPIQKLLADPVEFIKNNLLIVTDPNVWYPSEISMVDDKRRAKLALVDMTKEDYVIRPGPSKWSRLFGSRATKKTSAEGLYRVVMAPKDAKPEDVFLSYICPYKQDMGGMMVLGADADIMVTAEMTGCTFGIGSEGAITKTRMVMHANAASSGTRESFAPQAKAQQQMVTSALGSNAHLWAPRKYRKTSGGGRHTLDDHRRPSRYRQLAFLCTKICSGYVGQSPDRNGSDLLGHTGAAGRWPCVLPPPPTYCHVDEMSAIDKEMVERSIPPSRAKQSARRRCQGLLGACMPQSETTRQRRPSRAIKIAQTGWLHRMQSRFAAGPAWMPRVVWGTRYRRMPLRSIPAL